MLTGRPISEIVANFRSHLSKRDFFRELKKLAETSLSLQGTGLHLEDALEAYRAVFTLSFDFRHKGEERRKALLKSILSIAQDRPSLADPLCRLAFDLSGEMEEENRPHHRKNVLDALATAQKQKSAQDSPRLAILLCETIFDLSKEMGQGRGNHRRKDALEVLLENAEARPSQALVFCDALERLTPDLKKEDERDIRKKTVEMLYQAAKALGPDAQLPTPVDLLEKAMELSKDLDNKIDRHTCQWRVLKGFSKCAKAMLHRAEKHPTRTPVYCDLAERIRRAAVEILKTLPKEEEYLSDYEHLFTEIWDNEISAVRAGKSPAEARAVIKNTVIHAPM